MNTDLKITEQPRIRRAVSARTGNRTLVRILGAMSFAAAVAAGANIAVPLPGTPVPLTLQTFCVLLAGVALGPTWGMISMGIYILLGTVGCHAFAGGETGWVMLCGASGGYLIGFVLAQPALGQLTRATRSSLGCLVLAFLLGDAILFACGLLWLRAWTAWNWQQTLVAGLWPFLPGEVLKIVAAVVVGRWIRRLSLRENIVAI